MTSVTDIGCPMDASLPHAVIRLQYSSRNSVAQDLWLPMAIVQHSILYVRTSGTSIALFYPLTQLWRRTYALHFCFYGVSPNHFNQQSCFSKSSSSMIYLSAFRNCLSSDSSGTAFSIACCFISVSAWA